MNGKASTTATIMIETYTARAILQGMLVGMWGVIDANAEGQVNEVRYTISKMMAAAEAEIARLDERLIVLDKNLSFNTEADNKAINAIVRGALDAKGIIA
jgi:hypothetical protein